MQISRLLGIVYLLLEKRNSTARELADQFEVSTRTIYHHVDALAMAGIPVYTDKGKGEAFGCLIISSWTDQCFQIKSKMK